MQVWTKKTVDMTGNNNTICITDYGHNEEHTLIDNSPAAWTARFTYEA